MTIVLTDTKTTKRHHQTEFVMVDDPAVQACVHWARKHRHFGRLVGHSPSQFRKKWKSYITALGLDADEFTPYSLRRGGATYDYIQTGSLDRSLVRGRWQSIKAARIYVRQGEELLAKLTFTPQQEAHFASLTAVFRTFVQQAAQ